MIEVEPALGQLTWLEASQCAPELLVVPLGSTEQHGPHLPLDTDTRIAAALASRLARRRPDVSIAPPLAYGASGEHAGFPGTLSIGPGVLSLFIIELVRSMGQTFRGAVLLSGHGGNYEALSQAVEALVGEGRQVMAWFASTPDGDAHAGRTETSMMLALAPALVRLERAAAGNTTPLPDLIDRLRRDGLRPHSPNGVLGDPSGASAPEGESLLVRLTDDLCQQVEVRFGPAKVTGSAPADPRRGRL